MESVNRTQNNGSMTEQAKELRRAYKREWNRANREKVQQAQQRYWNRKAEAAAVEKGAADNGYI